MATEYRAIGPDKAGRWHVARCLPGCMPTGVMDCPTKAIAESVARNGGRPSLPTVQRLARFEMYEEDIELQRELDENYGMPRAGSPFADPSIPF